MISLDKILIVLSLVLLAQQSSCLLTSFYNKGIASLACLIAHPASTTPLASPAKPKHTSTIVFAQMFDLQLRRLPQQHLQSMPKWIFSYKGAVS